MTEPGPEPAPLVATSAPARRRWLVVRLLVSIAALWALIAAVDAGALADLLRRADPSWLLLACVCYAACILVGAVKWGVLLPAAPLGALLHAVTATCFYAILPTGQLGAEVSKLVTLARKWPAGRGVAVSIVFDKISGTLALMVIGVWALFVTGSGGWLFATTLAAAVLVAAAGLAAAPSLMGMVLRRTRRPGWQQRLADHAAQAIGAMRGFLSPSVVLRSLAWGLASHATLIATYWAVGHALKIGVPLPALAAAVVIANLAALVPISAGGFGLREASLTGLLVAWAGLGAEQALAVSLGTMLVFLLGAAAGGMLELHAILPRTRSGQR